MKEEREARKAARKARMALAMAAAQDDAIETVEEFISDGHAASLETALTAIDELSLIPHINGPAGQASKAIKLLLRALKSVPDEREETWAERNLPPQD
jgi:hypothetical protein